MNISNAILNYPKQFLQTYYSSLTPQQIQLRIRIALGVTCTLIGLASAFGAHVVERKLRRNMKQVKVEYNIGKGSSIQFDQPLDNVNGLAKVTYNHWFSSKAIVEGNFVKGKLEGTGKITYPIGSVREETGTFEQDRLVKGKMIYRDGKMIDGTFKFGKLIEGTITHPNGKIETVSNIFAV